MRKLLIACGFGVLLAGTAVAQQPTGNEPWANKLFSGGINKDFGTVAKGAQLKHSFKITNIYKVPLEITLARPSCDCVKAVASQRLLQPSESATLDITMDGRRFNGHKSVTIFVTVGPQFISTATLTVQANTRQDVVFTPGDIEFGVVQRGQAPSRQIDVEYTGPFAWRLEEIHKNGSAPFELKVADLKRPGAKAAYRITATLKTDAAPGQFKEEILLKTNDPTTPVLTFHINGNVQAPLTVSPPVVTVNGLKVGAVEETRVTVRGSQPFRITKIDGMGQGVSVSFAGERIASMHILKIRCQAEKSGDVLKTLVIHSSLDNETVPLTVEVHAAP